jgi:uncharacterized protein
MTDEADDYLEELSRSKCLELLSSHGTGRIGVVLDGHAAIFPVNYAVSGSDVFVCIRHGGDLARATANATVAFEIDGMDNVYHQGWSVLIVGRSSQIVDPIEVERQVQRVGLSPWAGGPRNLLVVFSTEEMTGRRLRRGSSPAL